MGVVAARPAVPSETAAQLLGERLATFAERFDEEWRGAIAEQWTARHEAVAKERATLDALQAKDPDARSEDEWWQLACLTHELSGEDASLPLCRDMIDRFPDHKLARYALGSMLLNRNDEEGLTHLEAGMTENPAATIEGWTTAYEFLRRRGRVEEAEALYARAVAAENTLRQAHVERARIDRRTRYLPSDAAAAVREQLVAIVAAEPTIKRAYRVRKALTRSADAPLYVFAVLRRNRWYQYETGKENQVVLDRLVAACADIPIAVQCYVVNQAGLLRRIRRVAGAPIPPATTDQLNLRAGSPAARW
jgi:hypothetical protein